MAVVLSSKPGTVAIIGGEDGDEAALPGRVTLDGFVAATVIIRDAKYHQETNQQFQSSLEDTIYMYVFGDKMGSITLMGFIFGANCPSGGTSGIEYVLDYYKANRASQRPTAVIVMVGDTKISGFLTAMDIGMEDPESRINRFSFNVSTLPDSDGSAT